MVKDFVLATPEPINFFRISKFAFFTYMFTRLKNFFTTFRRKRERNNPQSKKGVFASEKRTHPRMALELPLECSRVNRVDDEEIYSGMTANVSEGGAFVYLPQAMEIGALLKTEILSLRGLELNKIKAVAIEWWDRVKALRIEKLSLPDKMETVP